MFESRRLELAAGLRTMPADACIASSQRDSVAPPLPAPESFEADRIAISVVPRLGATARTVRPGELLSPSPDDPQGFGPPADKATIEIDLGIPGFVYDFTRALVSRIDDQGLPMTADQDRHGLVITVERMRHAIEWYDSPIPYASTLPLDETSLYRKTWATALAAAAERFLLAHELGHALLQSGQPQGKSDAKARETQADLFGLRLVLAAAHDESKNENDFAYAGCLLYLGLIELAEAYADHAWSDLTHPHAGERMRALSYLAPAICVSAEQLRFAMAIVDTLFAQLSNIVYSVRPSAADPQHPPLTFRERYGRAVEQALLAAATGRQPPAPAVRLILDYLESHPMIVVPIVRAVAQGVPLDAEASTVPWVRQVLLPALPDSLAAAFLGI